MRKIIILFFLFLVGCSSLPKTSEVINWGSTTDDIIRIVGEPISITDYETYTIVSYFSIFQISESETLECMFMYLVDKKDGIIAYEYYFPVINIVKFTKAVIDKYGEPSYVSSKDSELTVGWYKTDEIILKVNKDNNAAIIFKPFQKETL